MTISCTFAILCRPDMTFAVDWALNNNYLSIFAILYQVFVVFVSDFRCIFVRFPFSVCQSFVGFEPELRCLCVKFSSPLCQIFVVFESDFCSICIIFSLSLCQIFDGSVSEFRWLCVRFSLALCKIKCSLALCQFFYSLHQIYVGFVSDFRHHSLAVIIPARAVSVSDFRELCIRFPLALRQSLLGFVSDLLWLCVKFSFALCQIFIFLAFVSDFQIFLGFMSDFPWVCVRFSEFPWVCVRFSDFPSLYVRFSDFLWLCARFFLGSVRFSLALCQISAWVCVRFWAPFRGSRTSSACCRCGAADRPRSCRWWPAWARSSSQCPPSSSAPTPPWQVGYTFLLLSFFAPECRSRAFYARFFSPLFFRGFFFFFSLFLSIRLR